MTAAASIGSVLPFFVFFISLQCCFWFTESASTPSCQRDEDCVPTSCCHARGCGHVSAVSQDCSNVLCLAVCKAFTLDCGGECKCLANNCTSVIRAGRPPPGVEYKAPSEAPKGFAYVKVKRVVSVPRSQARALKEGKIKHINA